MRVAVCGETGRVETVRIGRECRESKLFYPDFGSLPVWAQERIAVLSIMSWAPPTTSVPDVGQRIDERVFWIEIPDNE